MAIFRKVHVTFWKDSFVESLTPEQKFFYLYLLTNEQTTQCGIYEITTRQICFDTGYNEDTVNKLLLFFTESKKIKYSSNTKEIALKNWSKYNDSTSPKVKACIAKELKSVKNRVLIQYIYSIDTQSQQEEEQEQDKEQDKEHFLYKIEDQFLFKIEQCLTIALKDPRWVNANSTNEIELQEFNRLLEKRGLYETNPAEYKSHFSNWKSKGKLDGIITGYTATTKMVM